MTSAERRIYYKLKQGRQRRELYAEDLGYTDQQLEAFVKRGFIQFRYGSWSHKRIYRLAKE